MSMSSSSRKRPREGEGPLYLYKQLREVRAAGVYEVSVDERDMTVWSCEIAASVLESNGAKQLARELVRWGQRTGKAASVVLELRFPRSFPKREPFVRVVRPRFCFHTGHVTVGGSLCTELLTAQGWHEMDVGTLLTTICFILKDGDAKVQFTADAHNPTPYIDYDLVEARSAFERVAQQHGWTV